MAITPYLYYQDVDYALKFLAKAFGFRAAERALSKSEFRALPERYTAPRVTIQITFYYEEGPRSGRRQTSG